MYCTTFEEYLTSLTNQVRKHGKKAIAWADLPSELTFGFSSPEGVWLLRLGVLKKAFETETWRENTDLIENYKKFGGKTPIRAMTRLPPMREMVKLYAQMIRQAIAKGEGKTTEV